ncbi:DUF4214 domain-containing protein [Pigmentiphaga aceris]|uniref:DUF4214 domain-containing protein n=1 Tax=Pigmentiphaga aceris TaxID=1940612 RepID=A0A5C0ATG2_9BURK|nr:DUF4214 domain-containing protein [Pigmentiphaga aceris]QEI04956.1 DUF4214 domain-containing protein [Pigmentiphaga aceris]
MDESIAAHHATIARLYAVLLDRAPDASGMRFWATAASNGASITDIIAGMMGGAEASAMYPPGQSAVDFVSTVYRVLFDREPDPSGVAFWANALSAQGAPSAAANAWVIQQILEISSQPLGPRPDGMSESAYVQTLADRAILTNKAEAGVYFATVLGSDNIALARSMLAAVTADAASVQRAMDVAAGLSPVQPPDPQPVQPAVPAITSADSVSVIQQKFAGYAGTNAQVDAAGLTAAQWNEVAAAIGKVGSSGITGNMVLTNAVTGGDALALLAKYSGTTAQLDARPHDLANLLVLAADSRVQGLANITLNLRHQDVTETVTTTLLARAVNAVVNATGASTAELRVLGDSLSKLADGGIVGTVGINESLNESQILTLLGVKLNATAQIVANVTNVVVPGLKALVLKAEQLAGGVVTGRLQLNSQLSASEIGTLIDKFGGTLIAAVATGMDAESVAKMAPAFAKFFANGITGDLVMGGDLPIGQVTGLLSKYGGNQATITAPAYTIAELDGLASHAGVQLLVSPTVKIPAVDNDTAGRLGRILGKSQDASAIIENGVGDSRVQTVLLANLDKIAANGLTGTFTLTSALTDAQLTSLLGKTAVAATVTVDVGGMNTAQLDVVKAHLDKADIITGLTVAASSPLLTDVTSFTSLLGKASGAAIDLQGASQSLVDVVMGKLPNFVNDGLHNANLTLSAATWQQLDAAALSAKLTSNAVVKVQGTSGADNLDFSQMTRPFTVEGGAGADQIRLGGGNATVLLGGRSDNKAADFSSNTAPPLGIDSILGVHNGIKLQLSTAMGAYVDELALQPNAQINRDSGTLTSNVEISFNQLYWAANALGAPATTDSEVVLRVIDYIDANNVTHSYIFVNDGTPGIDGNDFVVHVVGTGTITVAM